MPLVYDELRNLAAARMTSERENHTLQGTALVHEAYLRLVDVDDPQQWNGRKHLFAAAAEAMRRILVENARRKQRIKHGGLLAQVELVDPPAPDHDQKPLALDEALHRLATEDPEATGGFGAMVVCYLQKRAIASLTVCFVD